MKREIKFRAWTGENMISPDYISRDGFAYYKENSIPSKVDTIMQFTGLKDKNGVDIYEGDIIGRNGFFNRIIKSDKVGFIEYSINNQNMIRRLYLNSFDEYDEVIGNIYENPELINK